jgi:hypothetical protein
MEIMLALMMISLSILEVLCRASSAGRSTTKQFLLGIWSSWEVLSSHFLAHMSFRGAATKSRL